MESVTTLNAARMRRRACPFAAQNALRALPDGPNVAVVRGVCALEARYAAPVITKCRIPQAFVAIKSAAAFMDAVFMPALSLKATAASMARAATSLAVTRTSAAP